VINETQPEKPNVQTQKNEKSNLELLLELDEVANTLPTMTPSCGGLISPAALPGSGDGKFNIILSTVINVLFLVWCPGQKRIAPLSFFHGCRKRQLKD
jgi:hypothetical protein